MSDSTTFDKQSVLQVVFVSIDDINQMLPEHQRLEKAASSALFGDEGTLDSLGLVNLIVSIEQNIAERFNLAVTLADEKAVSRNTSPFRTVETLVDYVTERLNDSAND